MEFHQILDKVTPQIPQNMTGVERQQTVGQLVTGLAREETDCLRQTLKTKR